MKPPKEKNMGAIKTLNDEDVEAPELWCARLPFRKDTGGDAAKQDVIKTILLGPPLHNEAKDELSTHVRPDPSQFFHLTKLFGSVNTGESFNNLYSLDPSMDITKIEGSSYNGYMRHIHIKNNNNHEITIGTLHPGSRFFKFDIDTAGRERIVKVEIQVGPWKKTNSKRVGEISLVTNTSGRQLKRQTARPAESEDSSAEAGKALYTSAPSEFKSESYSLFPKNTCIKGFWGLLKKGTGGEEDGIWRLGIIWGSKAKVGEDVKKA